MFSDTKRHYRSVCFVCKIYRAVDCLGHRVWSRATDHQLWRDWCVGRLSLWFCASKSSSVVQQERQLLECDRDGARGTEWVSQRLIHSFYSLLLPAGWSRVKWLDMQPSCHSICDHEDEIATCGEKKQQNLLSNNEVPRLQLHPRLLSDRSRLASIWWWVDEERIYAAESSSLKRIYRNQSSLWKQRELVKMGIRRRIAVARRRGALLSSSHHSTAYQ